MTTAIRAKGRAQTNWAYVVYRIAILIASAAVFYPGLNPARITTAINRNVSLFTSSISYGSLVSELQRPLMRGWVSPGTFGLVMFASIALFLGICACGAGGCMSVGNNRMRYYGNTFGVIGSIVMAGGFPACTPPIPRWPPMAFAIFLAQVRSRRFRRLVQTFTTIPNFLGIAADANYLMSDSHMWLKMWLWGTWKGLGWSAIIYISSITGIDPTLYEAATVDGAGRFQKVWNVTVPQLLPTFFVVLLFVANTASKKLRGESII